MASKLNPYLTFNGDARQAMEYYREVFGGELTMSTFGEFQAQGPEADKIMHAALETAAGYSIMASDAAPGSTVSAGDTITVSISGDDGDALRGYWEKLAAGGSVSMPLEKQMWGDEFGMCVDRFGVPWMINIAQPQQA